jgi:hypothetical protein
LQHLLSITVCLALSLVARCYALLRVNLSVLTGGKDRRLQHTQAITNHCIKTQGELLMIPAWIVYSWPPVLWQAIGVPLFNFGHLGTRVLSAGNAHNPCSGQTVWGRASDEGAAGVAWDWVQLQEGVVAMADPMGLITNLRIVDEHGDALPALSASLHLNEIVHALPWQTEVQRVLQHDAH